jgi:UrcA family protein
MKTIKSLVSVAALVISGIAAAGSPDDQSVVVRYGDLNLNSQAGVASLHKRIRNAAESVCSELNNHVLVLRDMYKQCVIEAVSNGVSQVANPNLSNFHRSKGKTPVVASN